MNVGGAEPVVASAASKSHFSAVFVTRAIDDPPFAMIQGEGANAGTHHNWEEISSMVKMLLNDTYKSNLPLHNNFPPTIWAFFGTVSTH